MELQNRAKSQPSSQTTVVVATALKNRGSPLQWSRNKQKGKPRASFPFSNNLDG